MNSLPLRPLFPSRRRSTSQMCLHRILTVIATVPPLSAAREPPFLASETEKPLAEGGTGWSGFDLNSPEPKDSLSSSSSRGGGSGGGDLAENVDSENPRVEIEEAERSLTMLIEAAQLIFGEFVDGDKSERNGFALKNDDVAADVEPSGGEAARRSSCWTAEEIGGEFEESSPVARSKRGRTRVLPCRYRDSVLEPLTRFSRTGSTAPPAKRRRR